MGPSKRTRASVVEGRIEEGVPPRFREPGATEAGGASTVAPTS